MPERGSSPRRRARSPRGRRQARGRPFSSARRRRAGPWRRAPGVPRRWPARRKRSILGFRHAAIRFAVPRAAAAPVRDRRGGVHLSVGQRLHRRQVRAFPTRNPSRSWPAASRSARPSSCRPACCSAPPGRRDPREAFHILAAGFGIQTVYLIGVYYGIWFGISTGLTALVVGLQPLLTGVLSGRVLGETVTRRNWTGLVLGFAGLAFVVWDKIASPAEALWGLAMLVLGLAAITAGTLSTRSASAASSTCGRGLRCRTSCLASSCSFSRRRSRPWKSTGPAPSSSPSCGRLSACRSSGSRSTTGWCSAAPRRGSTSLIYLSPPTTAVMGWAVFGEVLSWKILAGMALAMIGVALAVRAR